MIQTDLYSFSYKKGSLVPWCKKCGEQNFYRAGKNKENKQRYKCKKCGLRFVWTSDLPRRNFFSNVISYTTELYAIAVLQKAMKQAHGVRPNKIVTDGLWQYPVAIKKVIGWNWKIQKASPYNR
jgi:transposase-like protein